jgi:hypothetical protein
MPGEPARFLLVGVTAATFVALRTWTFARDVATP